MGQPEVVDRTCLFGCNSTVMVNESRPGLDIPRAKKY